MSKGIIFSGLPRSKPVGKTRTAIEEMIHAVSAIYIAGKHEIVGHAVRIYEELTGEVPPSLVWLQGKNRTCKTGKLNCDNCLMKPDNTKEENINYNDLETHVGGLIADYRVITQEIIEDSETSEQIKNYGGLCPYQCLKIAAKKARFIFTVPQLSSELPHKELLVVDEEPTFLYFFASSALICEYTHNAIIRSVSLHFPDEIDQIKEKIEPLERHFGYHTDILNAIALLKEYREIFVKFKEHEWSSEELWTALMDVEKPEYNNPRRALEWLDKCHVRGDYIAHMEAALFPAKMDLYEEASIGKAKVMMIGNEERQVRDLPSHDRAILIGSTMTKELAEKIYDEVEVRTFSQVDYLKNFCIVPFEFTEKSGEDDKGKPIYRYSSSRTKKAMRMFSRELYKASAPHIVVTGSKEAQDRAFKRFEEEGNHAEMSLGHKRKDQFDNLITGRANIIYANSIISRGIDLDFYDVTIMYHCDFTTPYQSAMISLWEGMASKIEKHLNQSDDNDMRGKKYINSHHSDDTSERGLNSNQKNDVVSYVENQVERYTKMRDSIISDEIVNLAFRTAPVILDNQPKLIIAPNKYIEVILNRMMSIIDSNLLAPKQMLFSEKIDNMEDVKNLAKITRTLLSPVQKENYWDQLLDIIRDRKKDVSVQYGINVPNVDSPFFKAVEVNRFPDYLATEFNRNKNTEPSDSKKHKEIERELLTFIRNISRSGRGVSSSVIIKHIRKKVPTCSKKDANEVLRRLERTGILYKKKKGKKTMYYMNLNEDENAKLDDIGI